MAMSSLSAQLAGLSGQKQPTSRRHEDAIGRGLTHSTQHGYSVSTSSAKYKPSVLYADAKSASDIPLTTLRDNAVSGLNQLTRITGVESFVSRDYTHILCGKSSITWERRVAQKSDVAQRDALCTKLLRLLSTIWGDDENSDVIDRATSVGEIARGVTSFASGLHVIEYLLRLYAIHVHCAESLLLSVLPAHETPLFQRVLQLLDLAEVAAPTYAFLRPYAAPGAEVVPRGRISRAAAADDALISRLCAMATAVARIHAEEQMATGGGSGGGGSGGGPVTPRKGVSRVLSFVAAVLVEALTIQTTAATAAGSAKEPTVRLLLPFVLKACCGREDQRGSRGGGGGGGSGGGGGGGGRASSLSVLCPDYRSLGYVLASCLVSKCPGLSADVREVMAGAIARGAVEMASALGCCDSDRALGGEDEDRFSDGAGGAIDPADEAAATSLVVVEEVTTSMLALLSVLSLGLGGDAESTAAAAAALARVRQSGRHQKGDINEDALGIALAASTVRPLARLPHVVPAAMGEMVQNQDIDVAGLMASLFVRSFELMLPASSRKAAKKSSKRSVAKRKEALALILQMIKEPSLQDVWRDHTNNLTASFASHVVLSFAATIPDTDTDAKSSGGDEEGRYILDSYQRILRSLRTVDPSGSDAGIAHAVSPLKGKKKKKRQVVAERLELLLGKQSISSSVSANDKAKTVTNGASADAAAAVDDEFLRLLPARVALEHPDSPIRLDAIKRILSECEEGASADNEMVEESEGPGLDEVIGMCRSLLRRYVADDDSGVAAAAASATCRLVAEGIIEEEVLFADHDAIQDVITGLLKWSVLDVLPSKSSYVEMQEGDEELPQSEMSEDIPPPEPVEALCSGLALAGLAASTLLGAIDDEDVYSDQIDAEGEMLKVLLLYIGAHLDITSDGIDDEESSAACELVLDAASSALIHAVAKDEEVDTAENIQEQATQLLCGYENCLAVLLKTCSRDASEETGHSKSMERRYMWACLHSMATGLDSNCTDGEDSDDEDVGHDNTTQNVLSIIHFILRTTEDVSDREACVLLCHLVSCFASIINKDPVALPAVLIDLCAVSSMSAYEKVSKPSILLLFGTTDDSAETNLSPVAILFEASSRHGVDEKAIARMTALATTLMSDENIVSPQDNIVNGFVQALSLLSHSSRSVREPAVEFLSKLASLKITSLPAICIRASKALLSFKSSLLMDGAGTLPQYLSEIITKSGSAIDARECLMKHTIVAAIGTTGGVEEVFSFGDYLGGALAACIILDSMNEAGEEVFPLAEQWQMIGRPLFDALLSNDSDTYSDRYMDIDMYAVRTLCESVIVMLKGITTSPNVVISTGPARGGRRARSYSVGTGDDGFSFLERYPEDMSSALSTLLGASAERIDEPYIRLAFDICAHRVLGSQTWCERVFPKLAVDVRKTIVTSLLLLRSQHDLESAGIALTSLHIEATDLCYLLESDAAGEALAITCVADSIRNRASHLAASGAAAFELSSLLFGKLSDLSTDSSTDTGYDYTRISLLQALFAIHEEMVKQNVLLPKKKNSSSSRKKGARSRSQSDAAIERFAQQSTLLVAFLGGEGTKIGTSIVRPIGSGRGRNLVLSLLTTLCSQAPSSVVGSLIPALGHVVAASSSLETSASAGQALQAIVPAYCRHALSSGMTYANLVDAFINSCQSGSSGLGEVGGLCTYFAEALCTVPMQRGHGEAIASFVGVLVAADAARTIQKSKDKDSEGSMDVGETDEDETRDASIQDAISLSLEVFGRASTADQVFASLHIIQYIGQLMELLSMSMGSKSIAISGSTPSVDEEKDFTYSIDVNHLCSTATGTGTDQGDKEALLLLTTNLLSILRDLFSYSSIKKIIKNNEGTTLNNVCLSLWQELVQLQSNSLRLRDIAVKRTSFKGGDSTKLSRQERDFWEGTPSAAEECLDLLQRVLPVPDYLASVTNLLQDDDTDANLFVRTTELLSERASDADPYSHESTLFLEVVPELVSIISRSEDSAGGLIIKQASLIALERLARVLCLNTGDEQIFKKSASGLLPALNQVVLLLTSLSKSLVNYITRSASDDEITLNDAEVQLLSTAAICASTLVAVLRQRCLPFLSKLVKPIISSLSSINSWLSKNLGSDQIRNYKSAKVSQLALLRTLVSVAETLPQFAVPYLNSLFIPLALPSRTLRQGRSEEDTLVTAMTERLDQALSKRTPARQLIPAASKAVANCLKAAEADETAGWQEAKALLSILKVSIECTARTELTPVVGKLLNALLLAYTFDESDEGQQELLAAANAALLALVMKLSEAQLRPLYARIREWRGDLDDVKEEDAASSATKRYAFWSMSALLSSELRSIFLPCLSSVLVDAIKELEFASSKLCSSELFSKKSGGKKRCRLGSGEGDFDPVMLKPLQPILLCLESALKADAHEGGNWIRGDDGQRHTLILEPLGKLLQAKFPSDMPVLTDLKDKDLSVSTFEKLVQGIGTLEYGSVSRCIEALALAAGDERMWKPVNHALLRACGSSDRAEVRKAGVASLKSIMESVGEEYMVLIAECLPTLSEMLEDEDEEIAALANACVTLGEELTGEDLQDALR